MILAAATTLAARLRRLAGKYRVLAELRGRREAVEATGATGFSPDEDAVRTRAFREVAREFPGALRELEHSTHRDLSGRLAAVEAELEALPSRAGVPGPERSWIAVVMDYHDLLREALAIKLWLAGSVARTEKLSAGHIQAFHRWHAAHPCRHTPTETFDRARLQLYRRPPGGRLHAIVWEELGRRFGMGRRELERMVFRPPA